MKQQLLNELFAAMEERVTAKAAYEAATEKADRAYDAYLAYLRKEREAKTK